MAKRKSTRKSASQPKTVSVDVGAALEALTPRAVQVTVRAANQKNGRTDIVRGGEVAAARLAADEGFVEYDGGRSASITPKGRALAEAIAEG